MSARTGCNLERIELQVGMETFRGVISEPEFLLIIDNLEEVRMTLADMKSVRDILDDAISRYGDWNARKGGGK